MALWTVWNSSAETVTHNFTFFPTDPSSTSTLHTYIGNLKGKIRLFKLLDTQIKTAVDWQWLCVLHLLYISCFQFLSSYHLPTNMLYEALAIQQPTLTLFLIIQMFTRDRHNAMFLLSIQLFYFDYNVLWLSKSCCSRMSKTSNGSINPIMFCVFRCQWKTAWKTCLTLFN